MRKLLAGCLALCIPALLTALRILIAPKFILHKNNNRFYYAIGSRHRPQAVDGLQADGQYRRGHRAA